MFMFEAFFAANVYAPRGGLSNDAEIVLSRIFNDEVSWVLSFKFRPCLSSWLAPLLSTRQIRLMIQ